MHFPRGYTVTLNRRQKNAFVHSHEVSHELAVSATCKGSAKQYISAGEFATMWVALATVLHDDRSRLCSVALKYYIKLNAFWIM